MAGLIMEKGGIARRIVDLAAAIVGWITGSLLMVAVVTGTGLAAISGSGSADTAAIGSMLIPEMRKRRYDLDFSASIIAAAGALGPIIPPSIIMVVIAITSNLSVGAMFLGGVAPGLLMGIGLLWTSYAFARRGGSAYLDAEPFSLGRLWRAFVAAIPALFIACHYRGRHCRRHFHYRPRRLAWP
jgi:C4-dicarboxylate transporter DctM subunit